MNVLINALRTLTARLLDQNIIPIGRLESNHCVLILKLALVAGQAPNNTRNKQQRASGMLNLRSRSHRESVSSYHRIYIFLIIDHVYGRKRKRKKEKKHQMKKIGSSHMAYIMKISVCAEILGTFR